MGVLEKLAQGQRRDERTQVQHVTPAPVERDERGRLKPGQVSLNPRGRTKRRLAWEVMIKEATDDGAEILESALTALRSPETRERDKQAIRVFLIEQGWGKALQRVQSENLNLSAHITDAQPVPIERLSEGALDELLAAMRDPHALPAGVVDASFVEAPEAEPLGAPLDGGATK